MRITSAGLFSAHLIGSGYEILELGLRVMSGNPARLVPEKILSVLERNTGGPESAAESMFQVMCAHML